MQIKKIALAIAATLLAGQAAAAPVTQADIAAATNLQQAWLSGASAPTYNVFAGFALGCDADSLAIFTSHTVAARPGSLKDYSAYACTRSGVVSVMYHTTKDGSFNAYAPHVPNNVGTNGVGPLVTTALERVENLATATCTSTGVWDGSAYGFSATVPVKYNCPKVMPSVVPDSAIALPNGGFSDVEAGLFGVDVAAYGIEAEANVGQVFGVAVSKPLYRELQVAQGLYADVAAADAADPGHDPANAPNITSAQYTSIIQLQGGYQGGWQKLLAGSANEANPVYLMRRVPTSGTQASSNAYFLKNPCASGATSGQVFPAKAGDSTAAFVVTEDSSSSTLKTNMTTAGNAGKFVIGVLSLENKWGSESAANGGYRFLKLDGVHPEGSGDTAMARKTATNGDYGFVMEMKSFVATTSEGTFGETLIGQISAALGTPANCSDVPRGLFLHSELGAACTRGVVTHKGNKGGNNCSPVQLYY